MRRVWLPLVLFAIGLIVASANVLTKYGAVYVGESAVFLYSAYVVLGLWLLTQWGRPVLARLPDRVVAGAIAIVLLVITVLLVVLYPRANSGELGPGSDRDEALNQATTSLLRNEYPYYQVTYLNNPITPLPGALLLAAPFVLLGNSIYQIPFWLAVWVMVLRRYVMDSRSLLLLLLSVFALAPKVGHEIVTGGDFITNAMYVMVAFVVLMETTTRHHRAGMVLSAILVGITLSSRLNWLFLVPLLAAALAERRDWRTAIGLIAIAGGTFTAVTLPFYLYDPAGFSPLHTANKLGQMTTIGPYISLLLTGAAAVLLAWRQRGSDTFFRNGAIVQAIPVAIGVVVPFWTLGYLNLTYGTRYGAIYILFAAVAYWKWEATHERGTVPPSAEGAVLEPTI